MKKFLINQTKKAILSARSLADERAELLEAMKKEQERPPLKATDDMKAYFDFLLEVAQGNDVRELWPKLEKEWQSLFTKTIEEFPEPNEDDFLKDIALKALESLLDPEKRREKMTEALNGIETNMPDETPQDIKDFISYLKKVVSGDENPEDVTSLPEKYQHIMTRASRDVQQTSLLKDFTELTTRSLLASQLDESAQKDIQTLLDSRMKDYEESGDKEVVSIIKYLKSIAAGTADPELEKVVDEGILEMIDTIKNKIGLDSTE